MPFVLYKRSPPPPEPEDDDPPISPSYDYEYPEFETMRDYIDERGPNTDFLDDDDDRDLKLDIPTCLEPKDDYIPNERSLNTNLSHDIPMYEIADNFDSLCNDGNAYSKEDFERQTYRYATAALDHYNSQEKNMIKYELIKAITSTGILDGWRIYAHVNFTAKSSLENSKEEFFFAELRSVPGGDTYVPTCIVSLEEEERIGGVQGSKGNDGYYGEEIRVDTQHCYACREELMHPENGTLYEIGHHVDDCYGYL